MCHRGAFQSEGESHVLADAHMGIETIHRLE